MKTSSAKKRAVRLTADGMHAATIRVDGTVVAHAAACDGGVWVVCAHDDVALPRDEHGMTEFCGAYPAKDIESLAFAMLVCLSNVVVCVNGCRLEEILS